MDKRSKYVGLEISESYVEDLENKLTKVRGVITLAEEWARRQDLEETAICRSAMKDIRRIVRVK